jgi:hypothetical protein
MLRGGLSTSFTLLYTIMIQTRRLSHEFNIHIILYADHALLPGMRIVPALIKFNRSGIIFLPNMVAA